MSGPIIRVEGIGKKYRLGSTISYDTLRDHITGSFRSLCHIISGNKKSKRGREFLENQTLTDNCEFWALKDISLTVDQGEVIGILGRNGAGKSTLLKILSQITEPTEGEIRIKGRVASLLEVGTGFHPELTGRENIFLNGAILGMTRSEIKKKFDEIVDFAKLEKFIDTPVKRYSSGMYVRLAFSVAAHLEPEILLVDEVLSVGDVEFQKKCSGKMNDVAKEGKTVLYVSHNMGSIAQLCSKAILLDYGKMVRFDAAQEVINQYIKNTGTLAKTGAIKITDRMYTTRGKKIKFSQVTMRDSRGNVCNNFLYKEDFSVEIDFDIYDNFERGVIGIGIRTLNGSLVTIAHNQDNNNGNIEDIARGSYKIKANFNNILRPGIYSLNIKAYEHIINGETIDVSDLIQFEIANSPKEGELMPVKMRSGLVEFEVDWSLEELAASFSYI
ncbi:ABC transporter ATP-binding protein [bacterium]|nr:ABC transporter ATP-binding protein [bacterium]